jgi:hypothetical protein
MAEERDEEIQLDPELIVQEEETQEEPQQAQSQEPQEEEIPEKYRGKSPAELMRMHQDAERLLGRQGNEVGELRQIVNDILAAQTANSSNAPEPEPEITFFEDPDRATEYKIKKGLEPVTETLNKINGRFADMEKKEKAQELLRRHPDAPSIVNSPDFLQWVDGSNARKRMYEAAATQYDSEMAVDLLDLWKERKETQQASTSAAQSQRKQSVQQASTGSGRASNMSRGKPTLSRDAIVELKRTDPEKYMRMLPQLKQAYIEGRVK